MSYRMADEKTSVSPRLRTLLLVQEMGIGAKPPERAPLLPMALHGPRPAVGADMEMAQARLALVHSVRDMVRGRVMRGVVPLPDGIHHMGDREEQMVVRDRERVLGVLGGTGNPVPSHRLGAHNRDGSRLEGD